MNILRGGGGMTHINNSDVSDNKIGPEGAKLLAEALKINKTLQNLNLSGRWGRRDEQSERGGCHT